MLQGNRRYSQRRRTSRSRTSNSNLTARIRFYNNVTYRRQGSNTSRYKGPKMSRKVRRPAPRLTANPPRGLQVINYSNIKGLIGSSNRPRSITTNRLQ